MINTGTSDEQTQKDGSRIYLQRTPDDLGPQDGTEQITRRRVITASGHGCQRAASGSAGPEDGTEMLFSRSARVRTDIARTRGSLRNKL